MGKTLQSHFAWPPVHSESECSVHPVGPAHHILESTPFIIAVSDHFALFIVYQFDYQKRDMGCFDFVSVLHFSGGNSGEK